MKTRARITGGIGLRVAMVLAVLVVAMLANIGSAFATVTKTDGIDATNFASPTDYWDMNLVYGGLPFAYNPDFTCLNEGQSFTAGVGTLDSAEFYLAKYPDNPTVQPYGIEPILPGSKGYVYADVYAATYDPDSNIIGTSLTPIATSAPVSVDASINVLNDGETFGFQWVKFQFDNTVTLDEGTDYVVICRYDPQGSDGDVLAAYSSDPTVHTGNEVYRYESDSGWMAGVDEDTLFNIYQSTDDNLQVETTTTVTSDLNPSVYGEKVTFTASVEPASATGSVEFFDGDKSLGTFDLVDGSADCACDATALKAGTHHITAVYSGDEASLPSTSTVYDQVVYQRSGAVSWYTGQTVFLTKSASDTGVQVALTASVEDDSEGEHTGSISDARVTFVDVLTGKVLAKDVPVSPVGDSTREGNATAFATLSSGPYYTNQYVIAAIVGGSFSGSNSDQLTDVPASATITVQTPTVGSALSGYGILPFKAATSSTELGTEGSLTGAIDASSGALFGFNLTYGKKGVTPKGQVAIVIPGPDGCFYGIKSNAITSVSVNALAGTATVITKASIMRFDSDLADSNTSVDGGAILRMDLARNGSMVGFTVNSSKTSALYYSNDWYKYGKAWQTRPQAITGFGSYLSVR